jgi:hypothetical protein
MIVQEWSFTPPTGQQYANEYCNLNGSPVANVLDASTLPATIPGYGLSWSSSPVGISQLPETQNKLTDFAQFHAAQTGLIAMWHEYVDPWLQNYVSGNNVPPFVPPTAWNMDLSEPAVFPTPMVEASVSKQGLWSYTVQYPSPVMRMLHTKGKRTPLKATRLSSVQKRKLQN